MPVVDLAFELKGASIPLDYGYGLFSALCRVLPELHGDRRVGVHPIRGVRNEPRRLDLVPRSKLRLRLPSEEIGRYLELGGQVLDIDGSRLEVGLPRVEPLLASPNLFSRLVTIGHLVVDPPTGGQGRSDRRGGPDRENLPGSHDREERMNRLWGIDDKYGRIRHRRTPPRAKSGH
jgi:hypothetical protein